MLDHRDGNAPDNERLERTGEAATWSCESARRRPLSRALGGSDDDQARRRVSFDASEVWYASDQRARSPYKVLVYDDIGSLSVHPNGVEFRGQTIRLSISPVDQLERTRQSWNWAMYLLGNLAMTPVYALWWYVARWFVAAPGKYVVASVVALNLIAWAMGRSVTWIVATGSDHSGKRVRVWFAAGADKGWAGMFGATERMYQDVRRALQHIPGPPNQPAPADGGSALNER